MKLTQSQAAAQAFAQLAESRGFTWKVGPTGVVEIMQLFAPGDTRAYIACDACAPDVLDAAPLKGGSVWGSDGGSVGGVAALRDGVFVMKKSGKGDRFIKALKALQK